MKKPLYLLISILVVLSTLLAACQPAATPAATEPPAPAATQPPAAPAATQAPAAPAATEAPAAPAPTEAPAGPKTGGTLVFARASEAQGLDPHLQTAFSSFVVLEFLFESLFAYGDDMKLENRLAESYEWSDDGMTLTVKIRPNVKFHNGDDMTAEDVKFSYDRILNEETGAAGRSYFTSITEITVIDPLTVEFKLDKADATILSAMTNADILDKKLIEGGADPATEVVGTGPFMLETWEPDKVLMLAKNPYYWMPGLPLLDKIEMRVIPDEAAILAAMRAGEVDFAQFNDPTIALTAEKSGGDVELLRQPALSYHVLQLNPARDMFKDERVRNALSCALDRQQIIDSAALGEGKVTPPITNPFYAAPIEDLNCYTPDLDKAKALLEEAGATNLSFKIMAASDEPPTAVAEAQSIQAQLAEIGVTVEIEVLELGVYVQRWLDADFDATVALNGGGAEPALEMGRYWEHGGTFTDVSNWQTDEIDALLKEARVETDEAKRQELYLEVQKQLAAASPWIWMYVGYDYRAVQPWVKDFVFPANGANIHLREAWLDK